MSLATDIARMQDLVQKLHAKWQAAIKEDESFASESGMTDVLGIVERAQEEYDEAVSELRELIAEDEDAAAERALQRTLDREQERLENIGEV